MAVSITLVFSSLAQASEITIEQPKPVTVVGPLLQPFHMERCCTASKVTNTPRLSPCSGRQSLFVGSGRDCAGAENNIDIAINVTEPVWQRGSCSAAGGGLLRRRGYTNLPGP
jgi:hypothetical protein